MNQRKTVRRKKYFQRALTVVLPVVLIGAIGLAVISCSRRGSGESSAQTSAELSSAAVPSAQPSSEVSSAVASQASSSAAPSLTAPSSTTASSAAVSQQTASSSKQNSGIYVGAVWRSPNAQTADITKHGRDLMLLNKNYELPDDFQWNLVLWSTGEKVDAMSLNSAAYDKVQAVDADAYQPLKNMFAAAKAAGVALQMVSPYRSINLQDRLFASLVSSNLKAGLSQEEAVKKANIQRTFTGTSEHNTGLGFDLSSGGDWTLTQAFDQTAQFKWLQQHAAEYGFILRYAANKVNVTGIMYEPWHYRYVGVENAKAIQAKGMCLEEYIAELDKNA